MTIQMNLEIRGKIQGLVARQSQGKSELWINSISEESNLGLYKVDLESLIRKSKSVNDCVESFEDDLTFKYVGLNRNQGVIAFTEQGDLYISPKDLSQISLIQANLGEFELALADAGQQHIALYRNDNIDFYPYNLPSEMLEHQHRISLTSSQKVTALASFKDRFVVGLEDGEIWVWHWENTKKLNGPFKIDHAHYQKITALNFVTVGGIDYLLSYCEGLKICQTRLDDFEPMARANNSKGLHTQEVTQIITSSLGRFYTVGKDQSIRAWTDKFSNYPPVTTNGIDQNVVTLATVPFQQLNGTWALVNVLVVGSDQKLSIYSLNEEVNPLLEEEDQEKSNRGKLGTVSYQFGLAKQWASQLFQGEYQASNRLKLIEKIGAWRDELALELLSQWAKSDYEMNNKIRCVDLLIKTQHPKLTSILDTLLSSYDLQIAKKALDGLRDLLGVESLKPFKSALAQNHKDLIQYAFEGLVELANLGDDQALDLLKSGVLDQREEISEIALNQLICVIPGAKGQLWGLKSKHLSVQMKALQALYDRNLLKDEDAITTLYSLLHHSDTRISKIALRLLMMKSNALSVFLRSIDPSLHADFLEIEAYALKTNKAQTEKRREAQPAFEEKFKQALKSEDKAFLYELSVSNQDLIAVYGCTGLGFLGEKQALPRLSALSHHSAQNLRLLATRGLGILAKNGDIQAQNRLKGLCNDSDFTVRKSAFDDLSVVYQNQPLEIAQLALQSSSPEIRLSALNILSTLSKTEQYKATSDQSEQLKLLLSVALNYQNDLSLAREAKKIYVRDQIAGDAFKTQVLLLGSSHIEIRKSVLSDLLPKLDEPWALSLFEKCLQDPLEEVAIDALQQVINKLKNQGLKKHEALEIASRSKFAQVRINAYQAVDADWDRSRALQLLRQGLNDLDAAVSLVAFKRLLTLLNGAQDELLDLALKNESESVRAVAIDNLISSTATWKTELLWKAIDDANLQFRSKVFKALNADQSVSIAYQLINHRYQDVRHEALLTLSKFRDPRAVAVILGLLAIKKPNLDEFKYAEQQAILDQTLAQIQAAKVLVQPKIPTAKESYESAFALWKKDISNAIASARLGGYHACFNEILALATEVAVLGHQPDAEIQIQAQNALPYLLAVDHADQLTQQYQAMKALSVSGHLEKQVIWALNLMQDIEALQRIWSMGNTGTQDKTVLSAFSYAHDFLLKIYQEHSFYYEFNFKLQVSELYFQMGICPSVEDQKRAVFSALVNQKQGLAYLIQSFSLSKQVISEDLSKLALRASMLRLLTQKEALPTLLIAAIHHPLVDIKYESAQLLKSATSPKALLQQWLLIRKDVEKQDEQMADYERLKKEKKDLSAPIFLGEQDYLLLSTLLNHANVYAQIEALELLSKLDHLQSQLWRSELHELAQRFACATQNQAVLAYDLLAQSDAENLAFAIYSTLCASGEYRALERIEEMVDSFSFSALSVFKACLRSSEHGMRQKALALLQKHRTKLGLSHEALAQSFIEAADLQSDSVKKELYGQATAILAQHQPTKLYKMILSNEDLSAEIALESLIFSLSTKNDQDVVQALRTALSSAYTPLRLKTASRWAKLAEIALDQERLTLSLEMAELLKKPVKEQETITLSETEAEKLKKKQEQFKKFNLSGSDCHLLGILKENSHLSLLQDQLNELIAPSQAVEETVSHQKVSVSFQGASFLFTGTLQMKREDAEKKVIELGGEIAGSVTKKLKYLVVGEKAGSKLDKAKELGITTLTEPEFVALISGQSVEVKEAVAKPKKKENDGLPPLSPEVKLQLAELMAVHQNLKAFDTLKKLIQSEDAKIQSRAAQALAMLKHPQSALVLWQRFNKDPAGTAQRTAIFTALKALRDDSVLPEILVIFDQKRKEQALLSEVEEMILEISGHDQPIDEESVWDQMSAEEKELEQKKAHQDHTLNQLIKTLIKTGRYESAKRYLSYAKTARSTAVDEALILACLLPMNAATNELRQYAIESLGWRIKHRNSDTKTLISLIDHREEESANLACEGLALAGHTQGLDRLLKLARNADTDYDWRIRSIEALGKSGDLRAVSVLIQLAKDESQGYEAEALEALGYMRKSEIADEILATLKDALFNSHYYAAHALAGLAAFNTPESWEILRSAFLKQSLRWSDKDALIEILLEHPSAENFKALRDAIENAVRWDSNDKDTVYEGLLSHYQSYLTPALHLSYFLTDISDQNLNLKALDLFLEQAQFDDLLDFAIKLSLKRKQNKYDAHAQKIGKIEEKLKGNRQVDLVKLLSYLPKFMEYLPSTADTVLELVVSQTESLSDQQRTSLLNATLEIESKWIELYDKKQRGNAIDVEDFERLEGNWAKLLWLLSTMKGGDQALQNAALSTKVSSKIKHIALFALEQKGIYLQANAQNSDLSVLEVNLLSPENKLLLVKEEITDIAIAQKLSQNASIEVIRTLRAKAINGDAIALNQLLSINDKEGIWLMIKDQKVNEELRINALLTLSLFKDERVEQAIEEFALTQSSTALKKACGRAKRHSVRLRKQTSVSLVNQ